MTLSTTVLGFCATSLLYVGGSVMAAVEPGAASDLFESGALIAFFWYVLTVMMPKQSQAFRESLAEQQEAFETTLKEERESHERLMKEVIAKLEATEGGSN